MIYPDYLVYLYHGTTTNYFWLCLVKWKILKTMMVNLYKNLNKHIKSLILILKIYTQGVSKNFVAVPERYLLSVENFSAECLLLKKLRITVSTQPSTTSILYKVS